MSKVRQARLFLWVIIGILLCGFGYRAYRSSLNDRLRAAVYAGDADQTLSLLQQGADPGDSLLYQAANHPELLRLLLEKGIRETSTQTVVTMREASYRPDSYRLLRRYGYPPSMTGAIWAGEISDVKMLLDQGEEVNEWIKGGNDAGSTPLGLAIVRDQAEIVKLLLERGADVNLPAQNGVSPLHMVHNYDGPNQVAALLIAKGARGSLTEAIQGRDLVGLRALIHAGADVNMYSQPTSGSLTSLRAPLFQAINLPNEIYIARPGDGVMTSVPFHRVKVVQILLDAGANPNLRAENGQTPLMRAADLGDPEIVLALLAKGADLNAADDFQRTAIYHAAQWNHPDLYRLLKARGGKVDLFIAASIGDVEAIGQLVKQGANVNKPDSQGETPLMLAAIRGKMEAVRALVSLGANLEARNAKSETALLQVAWLQRKESIPVLLALGADINAVQDEGKTALMKAAQAGRVEMVRLLLAKGADIKVRTEKGETALSLAEKARFPEAVPVLRQAGAPE